ncbi:MAG: hypothetical protein Q8941_14755 [Bacteroidota bacterium]|nr:hypothetical protein [Bacteroidota bacterium]
MLFHRNFTYWIDKRKWKYYFLMVSLELIKNLKVSKDSKSGRNTLLC